MLGKPYGDALIAGEIALKYDAAEGSFSAWYFDHRFPINPQRYSDIIKTIVTAAHAADEPAGRALWPSPTRTRGRACRRMRRRRP